MQDLIKRLAKENIEKEIVSQHSQPIIEEN
jgi:hypothetical protein